MSQKPVPRSVNYYKRLIAATLALIILTLVGLTIYYAAALRRTRGELAEAQERLAALDPGASRTEDAAPAGPAPAPTSGNAPDPGKASAPESVPAPDPAAATEREKPAGEASAAEIFSANKLASRALGAVDGVKGLDCLEGFQAHYDAGVRVFEVDPRLTADGHVVLRRDWGDDFQEQIGPDAVPTLDEFLAAPLLGKYTPLAFVDLLGLMTERPDICVIIDTPTDSGEASTLLGAMLSEAHALGLSYLFDRIAVQVYSPEHYAAVDNVHHFPCYLYMLYYEGFDQNWRTFESKAAFCEEKGISGLVIWADWWDPDFASIARTHGVSVLSHNVNTLRAARWLLGSGVQCVYTDTLDPADLEG